jgi:hypothetical protein
MGNITMAMEGNFDVMSNSFSHKEFILINTVAMEGNSEVISNSFSHKEFILIGNGQHHYGDGWNFWGYV